MKKIILVVALSILATIPFCVEAQTSDASILSIAEQMPEYPGGTDSLMTDVIANVIYPKLCLDSNIQGKVYLRFIVNEDGTLSNIEAVKSPNKLLSESAIAATEKIKKYKPGKQNGKPVKVWSSVPVNFKIKETQKAIELTDTAFVSARDYFPGGQKMFDDFIKKNLVYPKEADSLNLDALILVKCKLNSSLKLEPVKILNDLDFFFNEEALRLLYLMPSLNDSVKKVSLPGISIIVPITFSITPYSVTHEVYSYRRGRPSELVNAGYYNLGVDLVKQGNYFDALKTFSDAIKVNPRDADAFYNRAAVKLKLNKSACDDFRRAYLLGDLDAMNGIKQTCK